MADSDSKETTKTHPWRNGYWSPDKMPSILLTVDGERVEGRNIVALDFPDLEVGDYRPSLNDVSPLSAIVAVKITSQYCLGTEDRLRDYPDKVA